MGGWGGGAGGGGGQDEEIPLPLKDWLYQSYGKSSESIFDHSATQFYDSVVSNQQALDVPTASAEMIDADANSSTIGGSEKACYVCTDDEETPGNPIVNPCNCKGGTKWVHVNCLRRWVMKDKEETICVHIRDNGDNSHHCDVCRRSYKFEVDGVKLFEDEVQSPSLSLLVLVTSDADAMPRGDQYQISFDTLQRQEGGLRPITIGRNCKNDVVLPCSSVSNFHANLHFDADSKKFLITDNESSNGTHVYLRGPMKIEQGQNQLFRIGRSTVCVNRSSYMKVKFDPGSLYLKPPKPVKLPLDIGRPEVLKRLGILDVRSHNCDKIEPWVVHLMRAMTPQSCPAYALACERANARLKEEINLVNKAAIEAKTEREKMDLSKDST